MKQQVKMTNMTDKKLDMALDAYDAPQPSELLKARILKAAKTAPRDTGETISPANAKPSFVKRYMAIAACLLVVGLAGFSTLNSSAINDVQALDMAELQETAAALGFEDIYNWVESEDASS